jgi:hypothetical protein
MIRARGRALPIVAAAALAAVAVSALIAVQREPAPLPARPAAERPTLLLLTSLPLVFGEGFSVQETGSPALTALESRYRVVPISLASPSELARGKLLLMAQPLAQPAEDLVALDQWVSRGGRLLLLADPMLEWPSERPLGDPLRPPPMFMDTGLLGHWGLRLDAPVERGVRREQLGGFEVATISPGKLFGSCQISKDRLVADCRIVEGRAIIVADADFLDVGGLGDAARNLDGLLAELASLERP